MQNNTTGRFLLRLRLLRLRFYRFFFGIFTGSSWIAPLVILGLIRFLFIFFCLIFIGITVSAVNFGGLATAPTNSLAQVAYFYRFPFSGNPSIDNVSQFDNLASSYFSDYTRRQSIIADEFVAKRAIWHSEEMANYYDFRKSHRNGREVLDFFPARLLHATKYHPIYPPEVGFDPITGIWHEDRTKSMSILPIGPSRLAPEYQRCIRRSLFDDSYRYTNFLSSTSRIYRSGFFDYSYDYSDSRTGYVPLPAIERRFSAIHSSDLGVKVHYYYDSPVTLSSPSKPFGKALVKSPVGALGYDDIDTAFTFFVNRYSSGVYSEIQENEEAPSSFFSRLRRK